jgi:hypothetical protein
MEEINNKKRLKLKEQKVFKSGIFKNMYYSKEAVKKMKLPKHQIPIFEESDKEKLVGVADNFTEKDGKISCDIICDIIIEGKQDKNFKFAPSIKCKKENIFLLSPQKLVYKFLELAKYSIRQDYMSSLVLTLLDS